jgi:hypothetical protein
MWLCGSISKFLYADSHFVLLKIKNPVTPGAGRARILYYEQQLHVNAIFETVVFNSLAIPFGSGTGTKNKCKYYSHS